MQSNFKAEMQQSPPQEPREPVSNPGSGVIGDKSWLEMRSARSCAQVLHLKSLTGHEGATSAGSRGASGRGRGPTSAFAEVLLQTAVLLLHINSGFCGDVSRLHHVQTSWTLSVATPRDSAARSVVPPSSPAYPPRHVPRKSQSGGSSTLRRSRSCPSCRFIVS